jgi:hypothetical protein
MASGTARIGTANRHGVTGALPEVKSFGMVEVITTGALRQ